MSRYFWLILSSSKLAGVTQKLNYNYDNVRILDMSTEACYQKIDPPSSCREPDMPSSTCETDGNVEIVGGKGGLGG